MHRMYSFRYQNLQELRESHVQMPCLLRLTYRDLEQKLDRLIHGFSLRLRPVHPFIVDEPQRLGVLCLFQVAPPVHRAIAEIRFWGQ
jgi:hypothetical protein